MHRVRERFEFLGLFAPSREDAVWFLSVFAVSLVGGFWLIYVAEIFVGDAIARTTQAHAIVLSRDPHLAAIGFIWPPLHPSSMSRSSCCWRPSRRR